MTLALDRVTAFHGASVLTLVSTLAPDKMLPLVLNVAEIVEEAAEKVVEAKAVEKVVVAKARAKDKIRRSTVRSMLLAITTISPPRAAGEEKSSASSGMT